MFKRRRISCLGFLAISLAVMLLVTGCARRTILFTETITEPAAKIPVAQPAAPHHVKAEPIVTVVKAPQMEPADRVKPITVPEVARPAPLAPAIKEEPLREEPVKPKKIQLTTIYFEFDMYHLSVEAREILRNHAQRLLRLSDFNLVIEGHCDERGTQEYNLALGERRAAAAMKYLVALGVSEKSIRTVSFGEEVPADPSSNEEAWAKNRRAEFILTFK